MHTHKEIAFEDAIEHYLLNTGGYTTIPADEYDPGRALFPNVTANFSALRNSSRRVV